MIHRFDSGRRLQTACRAGRSDAPIPGHQQVTTGPRIRAAGCYDWTRTARATRCSVAAGLAAILAAVGTAALGGSFIPPPAAFHGDRDHAFDLKHVRLDIAVDVEAGTVSGTATNVLVPLAGAVATTPTGAGLTRIVLDAAELEIERVTLIRGEGIGAVVAGDEPLPAGSPTRFETNGARGELIVLLDVPAPAGEPIAVSVAYHASPRGGLYFVRPDPGHPGRELSAWSQGENEDNRFWFPTFDFPDDKTTSAVSVTVRPPLEATATGAARGTIENPDGTRTYRYRLDRPHSTYLIAIVVGEFDLRTEKWHDVDLEYRVPKGRAGDIRRSFEKTAGMMGFFSDYLDFVYPWPRYAQNTVERFIYGGMENVTAATLTDATLHDERAQSDYPSDGLIAHELAHQWFGDTLTCRGWSEAWLNEGFATYMEDLWREHDLGRDEFDLDMRGNAAGYMGDASKHGRPVVTRTYRYSEDVFDSVIYGKGAWVLHMLRRRLGDAVFRSGMRLYTTRYAWQNVETADFRRAMEEVSGRDLSRFFQDWVFRPGHPRVTGSWHHDEKTGEVVLTLEQQAVGRDGADALFDLETDVDLLWPGRSERHRVGIGNAHQELRIAAPERPSAILLDPERSLLMETAFERSSEELLFILANASRGIERVQAAKSLGGKPATSPVVEGLVRALTADPFRGVRQEAASALGQLRVDAARDSLMSAIREEGDSRVRTSIARALGSWRDDPETVPALRRLLSGDSSYAVREAAVQGLGSAKAEGVWQTLTSALQQESHRDVVRIAALNAMAALGDDRAGEMLQSYARPNQSDRVRGAALGALARWASETASPVARRRARETIEGALRDDFYHIRAAAMDALGVLGEAEAIPAIERAAVVDFDSRIRTRAIGALAAISTAQAEKRTHAALQRQIEELRSEENELKRRVETLENGGGSSGAPAGPVGESKGP